MWQFLGKQILRYGYFLLALIIIATTFFGWHAGKTKLSYEFAKAIPTDNAKYIAYQQFRKQFGDDGNLLVIGIQTKNLFSEKVFNDYRKLHHSIKELSGVVEIISLPMAINLVRDDASEKLIAVPIFNDTILNQAEIDSSKNVFFNLPFYRGLMYNAQTNAWLMGVKIDAAILASPKRSAVVTQIMNQVNYFGNENKIEIHVSGLPYIRTVISDKIQKEMGFFLVGSLFLSALILLLFFRSFSAMFLSLAVVLIGVVWSVGIMHLMGYKITLLTALIPPLIVVIGIPNCIYFLNKYHTSFKELGNKREAILQMISKMGIVTLFCNIAAAIGFAVFALTESEILKEFGLVAGVSIMLLFFISLVLIPVTLNIMKPPSARHTRYLNNKSLLNWLDRLEVWSVDHRKIIYAITTVVLFVSIVGITKLKSVGYIVDDLPKNDKIYTDLKFFETHFGGVMPLEIVVDTKKKYGVTRNLNNLLKIDSLVQYLAQQPYAGKPLTITEGLKFAKQGFFEGDSNYYIMPGENDLIALRPYLATSNNSAGAKNSFSKLTTTFMDSTRQQARISVSIKDI
ncbi:MAG: MMPL family transporter, partial [Bacteroidota bacterium]